MNYSVAELRGINLLNSSETGLSFHTRLSSRKWGMRNPVHSNSTPLSQGQSLDSCFRRNDNGGVEVKQGEGICR